MKSNYDVVIIGAGWAGLALARQLKIANPDISVLQLEANTEFKAKVGEATVEMTGHYFVHRLGLVNYLYRNHLPKNGLRFFFDSEQHDLPLHEMSEHGTVSLPPHPAFQLDRARLERDLVDMNREQGIDVLMGAKVGQFSIDGDNHHRINYQDGEHQDSGHEVTARWLVDASGRASMIAKKHRLHHHRDVPKHAAAWGRFSNIKDIDSLGPAKWRAKVNGRFLSTIHFAGSGYWIWVIPLSGGCTSIGVVSDKSQVEKPPMNQADFLTLLARHTGLSELMVDADIEDFEAWGQLAYRAEGYISEQRWATTGFAAMFLDPLFSGGGDVIALLNDSISNSIINDLACDDNTMANQQLERNVPLLNRQANELYQEFYSYISNVYPILDCGELCSPILAYNTASYFLESSWDYMAGNFADLQHWQKKETIRRGYFMLEKILRQQIISAAQHMKRQDRYFDRNHEGFFESGADLYKFFIFQMGEQNRDGWRIELHTKLWVYTFLEVTGSKLNLPGFGHRRLVQECLNLPQILETPQFDQADLMELMARINIKLSEDLQQATGHTVITYANELSFTNGEVAIQVVDDLQDPKVLMKIERQARAMFAQELEYIAMVPMMPAFLRFCNQLDSGVMALPVNETSLA
jgi:flavin-dependent dehydrogenase